MRDIAEAYYKLLTSLDWSDDILIGGIKEGLNKFLSNCFVKTMPGRYLEYKSHYITPAALAQVEAGDNNRLIYEHMVPKGKYIQKPCEELAKEGKLTIEFIEQKLNAYWHLATVTVEEDRKLDMYKMPADWDGKDIFGRYKDAGVDLIENPLFKGKKNGQDIVG